MADFIFIFMAEIHLSVIVEPGCLNKTAKSALHTHKWRIRTEIHKHAPYCNREQDTEERYWGQQFAKLKGKSIMV